MNSQCQDNASLLNRTLRALDEIRPYLKSDGGDVELIGIDQGIAKVRLSGHCSNCPMSSQTLKAGIETLLRQRIPEIIAVERDTVPDSANDFLAKMKPPEMQHSHWVTAALREEHDRVRLMLKQMETALKTVATFPVLGQFELDAIRRAHSFLAADFVEHMKREEEILFPRILPFLSWGRPTAALQDEHREFRAGIKALEKALLTIDSGSVSWVAAAGLLCRKIHDHLFREENTIFFEADGALSSDLASSLTQPEPKACAALVH
jgi:Fe-S cluster biogenesis protein NfuA/hemerythrin-like domain-containing protein